MKFDEVMDWAIELTTLILVIFIMCKTAITPDFFTPEYSYLGFTLLISALILGLLSYIIGLQQIQRRLIEELLEQKGDEKP